MGMALYRRHRPQQFSDVVGQERVTTTLQQALKRGALAHAYLFSGPRGTGKTTVARLVARAVNCEELTDGKLASGEPCNSCDACKRATSGRELDLIEIDAASNRGIDEIRELRERIRFAPSSGQKKVFLIDEVHMLTKEAFNALLKTLEEPPEHAMFILATTEAHAIPATILSRVQHFGFAALSVSDLVSTLQAVAQQESIKAELQALELIAALAEGGARDALSLLDVTAAATNNDVTLESVRTVLALPPQQRYEEWVRYIARGDIKSAVEAIHVCYQEGNDLSQFARGLVRYVRLVMLSQIDTVLVAPAAPYLTDEQRATVSELAKDIAPGVVMRAVGLLNQAALEMRTTTIPQLPLEAASVQLGSLSSTPKVPTQGTLAAVQPNLQSTVTEAPESKRDNDTVQAVVQQSKKTERVFASAELEPVDDDVMQLLLSGWSDALAHVRQKNVGIGSLLKSAVLIHAGKNTARFAVEYAFHRDRLMTRENRHLVEEILQQQFKRKLTLVCVLASELTDAEKKLYEKRKQDVGAVGTASSRSQASKSGQGAPPLADLALDLLGGQVVE